MLDYLNGQSFNKSLLSLVETISFIFHSKISRSLSGAEMTIHDLQLTIDN